MSRMTAQDPWAVAPLLETTFSPLIGETAFFGKCILFKVHAPGRYLTVDFRCLLCAYSSLHVLHNSFAVIACYLSDGHMRLTICSCRLAGVKSLPRIAMSLACIVLYATATAHWAIGINAFSANVQSLLTGLRCTRDSACVVSDGPQYHSCL